MKVILYESNKVERLHPITYCRPSFGILCGGTTLYDLLRSEFRNFKFSFLVRDYLAKLVSQQYGGTKGTGNQILFLAGALVPDVKMVKFLRAKNFVQSLLFKRQNQILGAYLNLKELGLAAAAVNKLKQSEVIDFLGGLKLKSQKVSWPTFNHLWEIVIFNQQILASNLEYLKNNFKKNQAGVFVGKQVKIEPNVYFDASAGPIIIDDGTQIKAMAVLRGPLFIGKNCIINSFSELRDGCSFGPVCKVGGEIEGSVIQGYTNKQHYGFLGNSYVGQWVNLGAGTTNSDLKNTYGQIKMNGQKTGRQFLGCVIADYSKTAIGSLIYSGKVIGVGSLVYGTVADNVPSFTNAGSQLEAWVECPVKIIKQVQENMFARRKVKVSQAASKLIDEVYKLTSANRQKNQVKKGKPVLIK